MSLSELPWGPDPGPAPVTTMQISSPFSWSRLVSGLQLLFLPFREKSGVTPREGVCGADAPLGSWSVEARDLLVELMDSWLQRRQWIYSLEGQTGRTQTAHAQWSVQKHWLQTEWKSNRLVSSLHLRRICYMPTIGEGALSPENTLFHVFILRYQILKDPSQNLSIYHHKVCFTNANHNVGGTDFHPKKSKQKTKQIIPVGRHDAVITSSFPRLRTGIWY